MGIPYKFSLSIENKKGLFINVPLCSKDDINEIDLLLIPEIEEYASIMINFTDSEDSKLYIEGIEIFPKDLSTGENTFSLDEEGIPYFSPNKFPFYVYKIDKNNNYADPLIPGFYEIKIVKKETIIYSWIKIVPKNMSTADWEIMKSDIETTVNGLSMEMLKRKYGYNDLAKNNHYNSTIFKKIEIFLKEYSRLNGIIELIINNPKYEIVKKHQWKTSSKKNEIDMKSIQMMIKKPTKNSEVYAVKRRLNYNVESNQMLKASVKYLIQEAEVIKKYLVNYEIEIKKIHFQDIFNNISDSKRKKSLDLVNTNINKIKRMIFNLNKLLCESWINEVLDISIQKIKTIHAFDSRYLYIKKFTLSLQNQKNEIILNTRYQYYWKQSAVLYEIWVFIKLIESMSMINFLPNDGWIFNNVMDEIPFLTDGSFVTFTKGDLQAKLTYNQELPKMAKETSINDPLFTTRPNNKPDYHIDLYKKNCFIGSIVFDTKYRSLYNIWYNPYMYGKTQSQLRNYRDIQSKYFYPHIPQHIRSLLKPVTIMVIYPKQASNKTIQTIEQEDSINFQELNPRTDIKLLSERISEFFRAFESFESFEKTEGIK